MRWLLPTRVAEGATPAARRWWPRLIALLAGALLTLAFAPYGQWWLAVVAPAVLAGLWGRAPTAREGACIGFFFGTGLFAAGTWWLYISIHVFGEAPLWVALPVMAALVLIMAGYLALLGYVACRWLQPATVAGRLLWLPAAWVLVEWWRGWFLSGFPWLALGYSQTDSPLAGLAPVGGVHLIGFALFAGAGALLVLWQARGPIRAVALVVLVLPWTLGLMLQRVEWTHASGPERTVAIVQGAIPQDMKWLNTPDSKQNILDTYARLHREALGAQLILWPESTLPDWANSYSSYISAVWSASRRAGSDMMLGIVREDANDPAREPRYYNSLLALGDGEPATYDKRHLVPFGEYFPVPAMVRSWLRLMSLPDGDFDRGSKRQAIFQLAGVKLAPNICYEDAYPGLLRPEIRAAEALVTVTNDTWFGRSSARYQHLQIARMRALESRRYLLRAANDGVSAVIGPDGSVVAEAPEFKPAVLKAKFTPRTGDTPYLVVGNWLALGVAGLVLAAGALRARARVKRSS
jgi:apolipoprotein N-acyltransferase